MRTMGKLVSTAGAIAMVLAVGSSAFGQAQDKDQQGCINTINKDAAKVGATQGKENNACVKLGTKGTVTAGCPTSDPKGKVAKAEAKTLSDETGKCTVAPNFAYTSGATANAAMQDAELGLLADIFGGTDLTAVISTDKVIGKCQATMLKDAEKLAATFVKVFNGEKKNALKLGADDAGDIAALVGDDPKGKIGKTESKLGADATKACTGVTLASAFPGECSTAASPAALAACLEQVTKCRMCEGIEEMDGIDADCDVIDDGASNGSCGLPVHACVLDTTPASDSQLALYTEAFGAPLVFPFTGGQINLGAGGSVATCDIVSLNPVNIPAIGFVCISPSSGCPQGQRDCDGGTALGVDVQSESGGGACTSNAACEATANAACGGAANVLAAGCTGFCSAGTEAACTSDAACLPSNGACNGPNPIGPNGGVCQYTCANRSAHGASDPGDFQCSLGSNLIVETGAPCNGTDVLISAGQSCVQMTTQRVTALVENANFNTCAVPPCTVPTTGNINDQSGSPIACATVDASTTTGILAVGAVNFFGSALGDLSAGLKVTCQ